MIRVVKRTINAAVGMANAALIVINAAIERTKAAPIVINAAIGRTKAAPIVINAAIGMAGAATGMVFVVAPCDIGLGRCRNDVRAKHGHQDD
jgi:hypothetical protein